MSALPRLVRRLRLLVGGGALALGLGTACSASVEGGATSPRSDGVGRPHDGAAAEADRRSTVAAAEGRPAVAAAEGRSTAAAAEGRPTAAAVPTPPPAAPGAGAPHASAPDQPPLAAALQARSDPSQGSAAARRDAAAPTASSETAAAGAAAAPTAPAERVFRHPLVEPAQTRAVVLLYHGFDVGPTPLSVRSSDFEQQLRWLTTGPAELVHTSELIEFLEGTRRLPARVVVLHIDDALGSAYRAAWPLLERYGARFSLAVPTGLVGEKRVMSWAQVRELAASPLCEILSHGHLHRNLAAAAAPRAAEEVSGSRARLEQELGEAPLAYAYPLGAHSPEARARVQEAGYRAAFGAVGAPVALGAPRFAIPRTSVFHGDRAGLLGHYLSDAFVRRHARAGRR